MSSVGSEVTPVVLTMDEEANIGATLDRLEWADRVLVVDSGSTDGTEEIVRSFPNTAFVEHGFESFGSQWNFALGQVNTRWVLALDADYRVPPAFVREMEEVLPGSPLAGYFAEFRYVVLGRSLRRHLYPPRQVLFQRSAARFRDDGHRQRVVVDGTSGFLDTPLFHHDRKPLDRWLRNQGRYARREAAHLLEAGWSELGWPDRVRRTGILGPPAVFLYCLFGKGLLLEGRAGCYYTLERTTAELILSLQLLKGEVTAP